MIDTRRLKNAIFFPSNFKFCAAKKNLLLSLDDNVDEEGTWFSNSKSLASACCLAFAWFFCQFQQGVAYKSVAYIKSVYPSILWRWGSFAIIFFIFIMDLLKSQRLHSLYHLYLPNLTLSLLWLHQNHLNKELIHTLLPFWGNLMQCCSRHPRNPKFISKFSGFPHYLPASWNNTVVQKNV